MVKASIMRKKQPNCKKTPIKFTFDDIMDSDFVRLTVPIGRRFQPDVPPWTAPPDHYCTDHSTLKWLGTQTWPGRKYSKGVMIGKGRPRYCKCSTPGSLECVKHHINDKRLKLQCELGSAFWSWKFDEMGEEVLKSWGSKEQRHFISLLKANSLNHKKSLLNPNFFSSKTRRTIVSYYFNVFVPRRIRVHTMRGRVVDDSDGDDDNENESSKEEVVGDDLVSPRGSKLAKTRYLTGLR